MPIIKARNAVHWHQTTAEFGKFHLLSMRQTPELNAQAAEIIAGWLDLTQSDILVDVGCGCGDLLASAGVSKRIGFLPTVEEVSRLKADKPDLDIRQGLVQQIPLPDGFASKVVCNSVLIHLSGLEDFHKSLRELARIANEKALIYVGEMPDQPVEITYRHSSARAWLWDLLSKGGLRPFAAGCKDIALAALATRLMVFHSDTYLVVSRERFIESALSAGLDLVGDRPSPHVQGRRDYLLKRTKKNT